MAVFKTPWHRKLIHGVIHYTFMGFGWFLALANSTFKSGESQFVVGRFVEDTHLEGGVFMSIFAKFASLFSFIGMNALYTPSSLGLGERFIKIFHTAVDAVAAMDAKAIQDIPGIYAQYLLGYRIARRLRHYERLFQQQTGSDFQESTQDEFCRFVVAQEVEHAHIAKTNRRAQALLTGTSITTDATGERHRQLLFSVLASQCQSTPDNLNAQFETLTVDFKLMEKSAEFSIPSHKDASAVSLLRVHYPLLIASMLNAMNKNAKGLSPDELTTLRYDACVAFGVKNAENNNSEKLNIYLVKPRNRIALQHFLKQQRAEATRLEITSNQYRYQFFQAISIGDKLRAKQLKLSSEQRDEFCRVADAYRRKVRAYLQSLFTAGWKPAALRLATMKDFHNEMLAQSPQFHTLVKEFISDDKDLENMFKEVSINEIHLLKKMKHQEQIAVTANRAYCQQMVAACCGREATEAELDSLTDAVNQYRMRARIVERKREQDAILAAYIMGLQGGQHEHKVARHRQLRLRRHRKILFNPVESTGRFIGHVSGTISALTNGMLGFFGALSFPVAVFAFVGVSGVVTWPLFLGALILIGSLTLIAAGTFLVHRFIKPNPLLNKIATIASIALILLLAPATILVTGFLTGGMPVVAIALIAGICALGAGLASLAFTRRRVANGLGAVGHFVSDDHRFHTYGDWVRYAVVGVLSTLVAAISGLFAYNASLHLMTTAAHVGLHLPAVIGIVLPWFAPIFGISTAVALIWIAAPALNTGLKTLTYFCRRLVTAEGRAHIKSDLHTAWQSGAVGYTLAGSIFAFGFGVTTALAAKFTIASVLTLVFGAAALSAIPGGAIIALVVLVGVITVCYQIGPCTGLLHKVIEWFKATPATSEQKENGEVTFEESEPVSETTSNASDVEQSTDQDESPLLTRANSTAEITHEFSGVNHAAAVNFALISTDPLMQMLDLPAKKCAIDAYFMPLRAPQSIPVPEIEDSGLIDPPAPLDFLPTNSCASMSA